MPLPPFRDLKDPDEKRREIVWIAISFIVILATWLSVVLVFGYQPLIMGMTYDEVAVIFGGPGVRTAQIQVGGEWLEFYSWKDIGDGHATIVFKNGLVSEKSQNGLR